MLTGGNIMSLSAKCMAAALCLLLAVAVQAQEGFPLDGTWRGEWGADTGKSTVVIVMKWDGKNVNGMINPGPNVCLLYTSPSPRDISGSRMPSSA